MEHIYDMVIIGGGPAGYTAALYGARAGLDLLVLEKMAPGGQMALTTNIDNYPGFEDGVDGFLLGQKMRRGAERFGAKTVQAEAVAVDLSGEVKTVTAAGETYLARTVVLATGAEPRTLDIPGEGEWTGRGVHYCAACDGMFYRGKTVAVAGGGNSAAADALLLARIGAKVILVHRRDTLRASRIDREQLERSPNVSFRWNSTVAALVCDDKLRGVRLKDTQTGAETDLPCDGLFVSIGRKPATALVQGQLELDQSGYVLADETTKTSLPGVFAAGDVRTTPLRQIVTATADGAMAAHFGAEYLTHLQNRTD